MITDGINDITESAHSINSNIRQVHSLSDNNNEHISTLSKEVERFKVDDNLEYIWDKSFIVGHDLIDSQHKELVNAVNSMIRSCCSGTRKGFDSSIEFLGNYVVKHFSDEEEIQRKCGYPDLVNHKKIHEDFKTAATDLLAKWLAAGPTHDVLKQIHASLGDWLIRHIKNHDVRIGRYMNTRGNTLVPVSHQRESLLKAS
ncbi:MAG: hemerythrin family protein [Treponema sp.]|nr:hemerythrin family protein [Treponema sp.]